MHYYRLCQQNDFQFMQDDPVVPFYNIYFICQRNRVEAKIDTAEVSEKSIFLYFDVIDQKESFSVPASLPNAFESTDIELDSEYPFDYFTITNKSNDKAIIKSSVVLDESRQNILPDLTFLDLEVLYIGRTNRNSEKPIIDRTISHETLQKIYSEKKPDKDIHLLFCSFEAESLIASITSIPSQEEFKKEDDRRLMQYIKNRAEISHEQRTKVAEAALIRYFEPMYNVKYKNTFPKKSHTDYDECYKLDLNSITIEIDGFYTLFSEKISPSTRHTKSFRLVTDNDRRDLFDFT